MSAPFGHVLSKSCTNWLNCPAATKQGPITFLIQQHLLEPYGEVKEFFLMHED
ncbi:uncharacterized protein PHALS_07190 [Plasmopara halstedii]|uniref:Uncharacterized protein n=1 Tax=Plasmopara halstedii TaxID=4781 RepID=A0A0P1B521_PLAHL|nr:uncharacterized protein PHALS_07190 [Plasmopara halstedii]CEG49426.1 hypothetical protein PHALS_07190 [Plasmopara halstedii]|eukprot:XP_024585795.1 hypothetical protein PHALS_07190 [Plasmopara halstedii]